MTANRLAIFNLFVDVDACVREELLEAPHLRPSHVRVLEGDLDAVQRHGVWVADDSHVNIAVVLEVEGLRDRRLDTHVVATLTLRVLRQTDLEQQSAPLLTFVVVLRVINFDYVACYQRWNVIQLNFSTFLDSLTFFDQRVLFGVQQKIFGINAPLMMDESEQLHREFRFFFLSFYAQSLFTLSIIYFNFLCLLTTKPRSFDV